MGRPADLKFFFPYVPNLPGVYCSPGTSLGICPHAHRNMAVFGEPETQRADFFEWAPIFFLLGADFFEIFRMGADFFFFIGARFLAQRGSINWRRLTHSV